MKKIILTLGTLVVATTPIVATISCGDSKKTPEKKTDENIPKTDENTNEQIPTKPMVTKLHLDQLKNYTDALLACQSNFKIIIKDTSVVGVSYIKTLGKYPTDLYFLGSDAKSVKDQARPILEKLGFINKIDNALIGKKIGDLLPKIGRFDTNKFKIGYKVGTKFTFYGSPIDSTTSKETLYATAEEAVTAFLAHAGVVNTYSNKLDYFKKTYGNSSQLIAQFERKLNDYGVTKDLIDIKKAIATSNAAGDSTLETNILTRVQKNAKHFEDLKTIVNKWIPGGWDGTTNNATQKAVVINALDAYLSRGAGNYPTSLKVDIAITGTTLKAKNYIMPYGIIQKDKGASIKSKGLTRNDLLTGITKYAIIDTKINDHRKKIIFLFVQINNKWVSATDLIKQKAPTTTFVVEGSSKDPTYWDQINEANMKSEASGKWIELIDYVKLSLT